MYTCSTHIQSSTSTHMHMYVHVHTVFHSTCVWGIRLCKIKFITAACTYVHAHTVFYQYTYMYVCIQCMYMYMYIVSTTAHMKYSRHTHRTSQVNHCSYTHTHTCGPCSSWIAPEDWSTATSLLKAVWSSSGCRPEWVWMFSRWWTSSSVRALAGRLLGW